jgi:hypothetical protein
VDWINLAQDKEKRRALLNTAMNVLVPYNARNFLTNSSPVSFYGIFSTELVKSAT